MRQATVQLNRAVRRDCTLRHRPLKFVVTYRWDDLDKEGNVIKRGREHRSKSYVVAWIAFHITQFTAANSAVTYTDTGGTGRTLDAGSANNFAMNAGAATATFGVVVGSGTNAVTPADSKLQTQILNGTSANQLTHGSVSVGAPSSTATQVKITVARTFTNSSPTNPITINEIGLYAKFGSTPYILCIVRDKLGAGVDIANAGASKTLTYTLALTS